MPLTPPKRFFKRGMPPAEGDKRRRPHRRRHRLPLSVRARMRRRSGQNKKTGGSPMDVSQLSINTAVTLAEVYRCADTIFRASPPEADVRRQRKIRRWMCRYIRNMQELPKEIRRLSLSSCSTAWRSPENGRGTGRKHSEKRRVLLTFAYKARCGNSCGWRIGRMCKTRQVFSESS